MLVRNPGMTAPLNAVFVDGNGDRIDVDPVTVDILDPASAVIVNDDDPLHVSTGYYHYSYAIPEDADEGNWKIVWTGVLNGNPVVGSEFFNVTNEIIFPTDSTMSVLRSRLAEQKTDQNGDGSETLFTDEALNDMFLFVDGDLNLATLEGWLRKAAHFSHLINISESGSTRELSDKFKHAEAMLAVWTKRCGSDSEGRLAAMRGGVVGRAVNLRELRPTVAQWQQMPKRAETDTIVSFPDHEIIISVES